MVIVILSRRIDYPAQVKPPEPEPQLPDDAAPLEVPPEEKIDIFLCVSPLAHEGQTGRSPAWSKRIIFSNSRPQLEQ
jgi:hypothetical protein